ncbi:glycosyltransferase, partial [Pseudomonas sp. SIMBA_065]
MITLKIVRQYSPTLLDASQAYSFINFASIGSLIKHTPGTVAYFCDGMLMSAFMSRVTGRNVGR